VRNALRLSLGLAILWPLSGVMAQTLPDNEVCIDCHRRSSDERLSRPVSDFASDIHSELGFGCLDCHGAASGPAPGSGFLGKPAHQRMPALCGRCHSDAAFMRQFDPALRVDQVAEYATSVHGQLLAREDDQRVAVCSSCHPAHRIRAPSDPESTVHPLHVAETCGKCHADTSYMKPYGIPTNQRDAYERSVHWAKLSEDGDLSAPTCNDCHGNHGASPPGVSSVPMVCGQCHAVIMTLFTGSSHDEYFADRQLPGCATCHGNHEIRKPTDDMLFTVGDSVCTMCHAGNQEVLATFVGMRALIDSLRDVRGGADTLLSDAANLGMEVSEAQFELEEVTNALVKARNAIHSFTVDSVREQVAAGIAVTTQARDRGEEALAEHLFRRQGLVVSVGLILLVIAGLFLKIRDLERRSAGSGDMHSGSRG